VRFKRFSLFLEVKQGICFVRFVDKSIHQLGFDYEERARKAGAPLLEYTTMRGLFFTDLFTMFNLDGTLRRERLLRLPQLSTPPSAPPRQSSPLTRWVWLGKKPVRSPSPTASASQNTPLLC
jgi:hypothetical protein